MTIGSANKQDAFEATSGVPGPHSGRPLIVRAWRALKHRSLFIGVVLMAIIVILIAAAPLLTSVSPDIQHPSSAFLAPSAGHLFGTDAFGRDVFSRVLYGGRYTVVASLVVVLIGGTIGTVLGVIAGYFGGLVGFVIMRVVDLLLAFPGILLALTAAAILGPGLTNGVLAVAIVLVPIYARVVEGATVAARRLPYIEAAETVGVGPWNIIWHHILPNIRSGIIVLTTSWLGIAALWIAALGFLGLGVQPPTPEWGQLINDGSGYISIAWWIALFPGAFLALFVVASNFIGDGLRDVLDPTLVR
jgi:ABC-type dipeptide/oligopeptide/nickel transport system permease subunit